MKINQLDKPIEFQPIEVTITLDTKEKFDYFKELVNKNLSIPNLLSYKDRKYDHRVHDSIFNNKHGLSESQR